MLLCYDYQNGITNEEENIIFAIEPKLLSIGIIRLLDTIQCVKTTYVKVMDASVKTSNSKLKSGVQITKQKTHVNKYEPKVVLKDKVYAETYHSHKPGSVVVDETLAKIKA